MDFNPNLNFTENQRLGIRFKARPKSSFATTSSLRCKLYREMIRKHTIEPQAYNEKTSYPNDPKQQGSSLTGGIFNLDFSPDS